MEWMTTVSTRITGPRCVEFSGQFDERDRRDSRGHGPELLLVHGGASPRTTWEPLSSLAAQDTLVLVHKRGLSAESAGTTRLRAGRPRPCSLVEPRPHVLAHSYGVLGALIAATARPGNVRSLTLIEPPLFYLAPNDPAVESLERMATQS